MYLYNNAVICTVQFNLYSMNARVVTKLINNRSLDSWVTSSDEPRQSNEPVAHLDQQQTTVDLSPSSSEREQEFI